MSDSQTYKKGFKKNIDDPSLKYAGNASSTKKQRPGSNKQLTKPDTANVTEASSAVCEQKGRKSKPKYVPLFSEEGQKSLVVKLPGSHVCDCQASKHKLVNNCLSCGKVVCEQEGSGPCYFCGSTVCTPEEQQILNLGGKKADELRKKLLFAGKNRKSVDSSSQPGTVATSDEINLNVISEDFKRASAEKDKMLEFQRNSAARTKVYDDQSDYYNMANNQWLSEEQRKMLQHKGQLVDEQKRAQSSKLNQTYTFDLVNRSVIEDVPSGQSMDDYKRLCDEMYKTLPHTDSQYLCADGAQAREAPIYQENANRQMNELGTSGPKASPDSANSVGRIQDLGYKEVQDDGCCMSMHQPYASLLIRGIKKFEGRSWYINHRGVLWIASTAKQVSKSEIDEVENLYHNLYDGKLPAQFPDTYPTGCLLGCVTVADCLSQEQYRLLYPDGESESPFVAVCVDPRELSFKFPISGKHKIYKLDPTIHTAAKRGIEL